MTSRREFSTSIKASVYKRDGSKCIYCGASACRIDHVVPASKGGPNIKANAVCSCDRCNYLKGSSLNIDFITRAIFWLDTHNEDTSWVDRFIAGEYIPYVRPEPDDIDMDYLLAVCYVACFT
jgi:5-methylcytosine-specific restriction endonuclease McrA